MRVPEAHIDVVEPGRRARKGRAVLEIGRDVTFSTEALRTYAFARWEPEIYDLMVLAAAIEYADKAVRRSTQGWRRRISLRIPVHDVARWNDATVLQPLQSAVRFLTGDIWLIEFAPRKRPARPPANDFLDLAIPTEAVIPYSDGMDSRAVAGLLGRSLQGRLVRVRVGSKAWDRPRNVRAPFTLVPYNVPGNMPNRETSARSRGLRFALISGIAAYLTDAKKVIVPESGQGAIGPALVTVGHTYPDYRNHPLFTTRIERFLSVLLHMDLRYDFPRLWHTKGQTLREFALGCDGSSWSQTKSCWRGNQWSSVGGKLRQCGVCAACLLRRLAVYSAGLKEPDDTYVCVDLAARTLEDAIDPSFTKINSAYRQYAIAGVRHLQDLAAMAEDEARTDVARHAALLAPALGRGQAETFIRLTALLRSHADEWASFMNSLGPRSFAAEWI